MISKFVTLAGLGIAAAAALVTTSASAATIANSSFESPALGWGYVYNPVVSGNVFTDYAGVQTNYSDWSFLDAPDGVQTAFVQTYESIAGSIAMDVTGLQSGGRYTVSFSIADRPGYGANPLTVYFNTTNLGTFTAPDILWTSHTSASFIATGTTGTLTFAAGTNSGFDAGIGLDAVTIAASVPEPASWALMIGGFGLVGSALRRRRLVALTA